MPSSKTKRIKGAPKHAVNVQLGWPAISQATTVAAQRHIDDLQRGVGDRNGGAEDGWQPDMVGAIGELAVARYLGAYWDGNIGQICAGDVGEFEVRTCSKMYHSLIVHEWDEPDALFFCVVVNDDLLPNAVIAGALKAESAQKDRYWKDPTGKGRPAYFVPMKKLISPTRLHKRIKSITSSP